MSAALRGSAAGGAKSGTSHLPGNVGVLGLGRMGSEVAKTLARSFPTIGWDLEVREVPGVEMAKDAPHLFDRADVVVSCLPSAHTTRAVLLGADVKVRFESSSTIFIDTSTSSPDALLSIAAEFDPQASSRLLDAPILGRPDACGYWTMPVGGDEAAYAAVQPLLGCISERTVHVGPLGTGHKVKLLNNMMFAAINVVTAEAFAACDYLGLDRKVFADLVGGSRAATVSPLFRALAARMTGEETSVVFTTDLLEKDARLAVEMGREAGVPLRLATLVHDIVADAVASGLGHRDSAAIVDLYTKGDAVDPVRNPRA